MFLFVFACTCHIFKYFHPYSQTTSSLAHYWIVKKRLENDESGLSQSSIDSMKLENALLRLAFKDTYYCF